MRSTRQLYIAISLLLFLFSADPIRANQDEGEDYEVKARVARISLINGQVNLKRNGSSDWERARVNFPLVEGDTLATERDSRLEIQVDARNFVRVEASSILRILTLRDEGVALSIVEGTASVRLAKFDPDREYFEVDAPKVTLAAERKGLYRIDVERDGRVRMTARDGGRARIYSETSGFALREGRTAELIFDGTGSGDWEFFVAASHDSWDRWVDDRERHLAERLRYDTQYYDNDIWGAEDLDAYGNWVYVNDYGWIWRPHITVINNYQDWAPYRYGQWTWCPPYGWTWVGYEPWGWAPYHYGRWVYYNNYWAWCPRSYYYRHRSWWRPSLVAFHISVGNQICWYPLSYYHRDPRSHYYRRPERERLTPLRREEIANLRRVSPAHQRAVSSVAARDFGSDSVRLRAASPELARRAINAEPLRGDLPVRPANVSRGGGDERFTAARPARVTPRVDMPDRQTGAAVRTPGLPLDNELRRSRILQGREPVISAPAESPISIAPEARPTGAVTRPARPTRQLDQRDEIERGGIRNPQADERPARSSRDISPPERPSVPDVNEPARQPEPQVVSPARPSRVERETPSRPGRINESDRTEEGERPVRVERREPPARPDRTDRIERPQPREQEAKPRSEPPARQYEPPPQRSEPAPSYEPPARPDPPQQHSEPTRRYEPPPRAEPAPRYEPPSQRSEPPPQRSEPAPRHEPPPQRSEPPPQRSEPVRNDPPPRSEPAPQRSEPVRNDPPPRSDPPARAADPPSRSESARPSRERP